MNVHLANASYPQPSHLNFHKGEINISLVWFLGSWLRPSWDLTQNWEHWVKSYYVTKSFEFCSLCFCSSEAEGECHGIHWIQGIHSLPQVFTLYPSSGPYPLSPTASFYPVHCSHWSQLFHATSILLLLRNAPPQCPFLILPSIFTRFKGHTLTDNLRISSSLLFLASVFNSTGALSVLL